MPGETDLHKTLKKEACRWLYRMGYRCIAAEVKLAPIGVVDAVGTGLFRPYQNYLAVPYELAQVCFIECKASRADFLRDMDCDGQLHLYLQQRLKTARSRRTKRRARGPDMGKFVNCITRPLANLHYILCPGGIVQKKDLPPRWGLLTLGDGGVSVIVRAEWQESARMEFVESGIARTLTGDIYRADARAINSVNREIFAQQQSLAERIRNMKPHIVLAPPRAVEV